MKRYPGIRDFKNQHLPNILGEVTYRNARDPKILFYNSEDVVVDKVDLTQTSTVQDILDAFAQRGFNTKGATSN